ncbi:VCBS repeat-containing protein [Bradyrhizobium tropiciagri]|uniref:FG-GAP-like repeat-containing protein n=1 Tax=Bradyrhizobium tropiciagri TaxID=312253 RepID=UPI001BA5E6F3|nr:FG-GAP-like repeat-containing protein [Bradyrhizobium tropiciagri]MBR0894797.1 VCBS repeat-containing protein [Bradyrhizobium tropiciagri]
MDLTVGLPGSGADRIVSGTADDEINQALADVGAAGGGTVSVLQGTYSVDSSISITDSDVTLKGAGAGQTILQTTAAYPDGSPIILAVGVDNFTVQGLTVDGHTNDTETNGITAVQCSNGVVAGCEVLLNEAHNYGIWLVLSHDIQVLDNHVDGFVPTSGQEGIETWSSDNVLISGNTIANIGGAAINLGSVPSPNYGDVEGENTNIQVFNNTVDNATFGTSIGLAGPRSFGEIEIQKNTYADVMVGVRLYAVDQMAGDPDYTSATADNPQSLHDVDVADNQINLNPSSSFAILLQNTTDPGAASFSNINASDNVITDAPGDIFAAYNFDHYTLDGNIITATTQDVSGSPYDDIILGSAVADVLSGGGGADTFVFDSQPPSGIVYHILDYDQGNSGIFDSTEGDTFDFSALLSAGDPVDSLVRVLEPGRGTTGTILQIDQDGSANGTHWTTVALLDGVHAGQDVNVAFSTTQPAATLTVVTPAFSEWHGASAADFNGDGKADILGQNDDGLPTLTTMSGSTVTNGTALSDVGTMWHVAASADFNGDGKADILWQNDDGSTAIWTMNGNRPTGYTMLSYVGPTWHVAAAADFNGDGKADILWRNDDGSIAIWTMNGTQPTAYTMLSNVGPTWHVAEAADFNGDGKADILWQNDNGSAAIWTMNGSQPSAYTMLSDVGLTWHVAAAADFDGDGKADILWQNDNGSAAIWTMNGSQPSAYTMLSNVGPTWHVSAAADFNGDHKADILWQDDSGTPAIWTMNGTHPTAYAMLPDVGSDWHLV